MVAGSESLSKILISLPCASKTTMRTSTGLGRKKEMEYEDGVLVPGALISAAQTWIWFPPPPNLPQSSQEVRCEPGKNSSGASTLSEAQPTNAATHKTTRTRRGTRAPIRLREEMVTGKVLRRALGDDSGRDARQTLRHRNNGRKFPAHPRDSQDKTSQETTRWID